MATVSMELDEEGKPGFSMKEIAVLLEGICEHWEALSEPETTAAIELQKFIMYNAIADRVNRATCCLPNRGGGVERSADDVRQKWLQLKEEAVSTRRRKVDLRDSSEEEEEEDAGRGSYMDLVHDVMAGRVSPSEVAERVGFVVKGWLNGAGLMEAVQEGPLVPSTSAGEVEPRVPGHAPGPTPRVKQEADGLDSEQPLPCGEAGETADTDSGQWDCERTVKTEPRVEDTAIDPPHSLRGTVSVTAEQKFPTSATTSSPHTAEQKFPTSVTTSSSRTAASQALVTTQSTILCNNKRLPAPLQETLTDADESDSATHQVTQQRRDQRQNVCDDSVHNSSSTIEQKPKKLRKENFNKEETSVLLTGVMKYRNIVLGTKPGMGSEQKMQCWKKILDELHQSGANQVRRTVAEIREKWSGLRKHTLKGKRPENTSGIQPLFATRVWEILHCTTGPCRSQADSRGHQTTSFTNIGDQCDADSNGEMEVIPLGTTASSEIQSLQCNKIPQDVSGKDQGDSFSQEEVSLLLQQVERHRKILNSRLQTNDIMRLKERRWQMIAAEINNYTFTKAGSKGRAPKSWQEVRSQFLALQAEGATSTGGEASLTGGGLQSSSVSLLGGSQSTAVSLLGGSQSTAVSLLGGSQSTAVSLLGGSQSSTMSLLGGSQSSTVSLLGDKVSGDGKVSAEEMRAKATVIKVQVMSKEKQPAMMQFGDKPTSGLQATGKVEVRAESLGKQTAAHQAVGKQTLKENQTEGKQKTGTSGYKGKKEDLSPEVKQHMDSLLALCQLLHFLGLEVGVVVRSASTVRSWGSWRAVREQLPGEGLGADSQVEYGQGWRVTFLVAHGNDRIKGQANQPCPEDGNLPPHQQPTRTPTLSDQTDLGCLGDGIEGLDARGRTTDTGGDDDDDLNCVGDVHDTGSQNMDCPNDSDLVYLNNDLMETMVQSAVVDDTEDRDPVKDSNPGRQHGEGVAGTVSFPQQCLPVGGVGEVSPHIKPTTFTLTSRGSPTPAHKAPVPKAHWSCQEREQTFRDRRAAKRVRQNRHYPERKKAREGMKFVCDMCGKVFNQKGNLKQHQRLHNEEKSLVCPHCSFRCFREITLAEHLRKHTGERPYLCETCGKGFVRVFQLNCHRRLHSGERPFICQDCGLAFRVRSQLNTHRRFHTDVQPYRCKFCSKPLDSLYKLRSHLRIHTGERPYECKVCGKNFARSDALFDHRRRLHRFHSTDGESSQQSNPCSLSEQSPNPSLKTDTVT